MPKLSLSSVETFITHSGGKEDINLEAHRQRLISIPAPTLPMKEGLEILQHLNEFELGRFLLKNKGLNGYWTSYVIKEAFTRELTHPLEKWIVHRAPVVKATQERFRIFHAQLQNYLKDNMTLASVPCGVMDDLVSLDYSRVVNSQIVGIDLDRNSLRLAMENSLHHNLTPRIIFIEKDAWNLEVNEEYDLLTSNGLNIYEPDDQKVTALYQEFYKALKAKGILITSFLTPSPTLSTDSTWKNYNSEDLIKQKAIFGDILQAQWQAFRTEVQTRRQLREAGFHILEVIYDSQGMFPTIIAQK